MIVLAGPPGAGKTTVAKAVADRRGGTAIDLDQHIERTRGRSVADVIRQDGETAFRALEQSALAELAPEADVVLALGGGTLVPRSSCRDARRLGPVCGLTASPNVLDERHAAGNVDRPLSADGAAALLDTRREAYASVDFDVDAERTPERITNDVLERVADLRTLVSVVGDTKTRVLVGRGLAEAVRGAVAAQRPTRPVVIVADAGVPTDAVSAIVDRIQALYPIVRIDVPGGEDVKTWSSLEATLERAIDAGAGRQSVVVGIGGGATTDLAALVASLLGRGAPAVLVPTTLLSQVDASVGGKCAINSAHGRNLIGAFHPAEDVIVDLDLLASLDERETRCGLAEMLKIGIIADASLFDRIVETGGAEIDTVARAIALKAAVVAEDPYEGGRRKCLNLGHTLAHALESASGHTLRHGEAVAIGICAAARYSHALGLTSQATVDRIVDGIGRVGLPIYAPEGLEEAASAYLLADKKSGIGSIDFIAVQGLEEVSIHALRLEEVQRELVRYGGRP